MKFRFLTILLLVVFCHTTGWGQTTPDAEEGLKPYGSFHGGDLDQISLATGKLNVEIPIASYTQRGGDLSVTYHVAWNGPTVGTTQICEPHMACHNSTVETPQGGLLMTGNLDLLATPLPIFGNNGSLIGYAAQITMPDGVIHQMGSTGSTYESLDGTGFHFDPTAEILTDAHGVRYILNSLGGTTAVEDPNGNQITLGNSTDSLGRIIPVSAVSTSDYSKCTGTQQTTSAYLYTFPGPTGNESFELCYAKFSYNFTLRTLYPPAQGTATQVQSIVLPNGTAWTFGYDSQFAVLSQITLPTGGTISYTWLAVYQQCQFSKFNDGPGDSGYNFGYILQVASRTVNANDGTGNHVWTYSGIASAGASFPVTVTDPMANDTVHTITGLGGTASYYETQTQYYQGTGGTRALLKTLNTDYTWAASPNDHNITSCTTAINVVPIRVTTTWPSGKVSKQETDYDPGFTFKSANSNSPNYTGIYGEPIAKREYDYGSGAPGSLLRKTSTTYQFQVSSAALTYNMLTLPYSVQVSDGGGTLRASTTFDYDEYGLGTSGISTQHDAAPPNGATRGNPTSIHHWLSTTGGYLVSTNHFYDTGTLQIATDPKLNSTNYAYSATYAGAFPTSITNALNQTTTYGYDFNSGLLTSKLDPNNQTTSFAYDNMWRIATISYADGANVAITHQETSTPFTATLTKKITSSQNYTTTNTFDGVGRVSQSALTSDAPSTTYTVLTYDGLGRKGTVYNPTRCSTPTTNCGESTWGYATYGYDGLSRVTQVTQPDGSILQSSYAGNSTTVTDEAGKKRTTVTDAVGRLTQVFEDPSVLNYETDYLYDALDDLTSVTQSSSRQRTFAYDSLKRLTSASNPESGTVTYTYDADGNVATKLDARSVTTTYLYDALNRLTSKTYTDTTPTVTYAYDGNAPVGCTTGVSSYGLAIGRRTAMCDGAGFEAWTYNDISNTGWQTIDKRTTGTVTKSITAQNNLSGSLATLTYTSGRIITYTENGALRHISAQDVANGITYASNGIYAPPGELSSISQGASVKVTNIYNSRLQPCWIYATNGTSLSGSTLCTGSATTGNIIDLKYGLAFGTADNGNVASITNDRASNRSQSFTYDSLNRITSGTTTATHATDPADCWGEAYVYDVPASTGPWGNLIQINPASSAYMGCTQEPLNQTVTQYNQISGFCYDASGNLLAEASCPAGPPYPFNYNAENQLTSTSAGVSYTYDGDGKRVSKSNGKLYWYGNGGDPIAETDASGNTTDEYIFFGGKRIARRDAAGNIVYYMADHLGTSRIVTSTSGSILDESDFYPFGGERVITASSGNTYKFTGKERDTESGLDYFVARYHASGIGRFMSPDALYVEMHRLADPQQLNLYIYARDNPLMITDSTGLDIKCLGTRCKDFMNALSKDIKGFKIDYDKDGKVVTVGAVDKKSLSKSDKAFLSAIDDSKHHVTINAVGGDNDSSVFFGASHGSTHTINFDQTALLDGPGNTGGMTSAGVVGHETLEGYDEAKGSSMTDGHNWAASLGFPGMSPMSGGTYRLQNGMVIGMTGDFQIQGTNTVETIGIQFVTPIPQDAFLKNAESDHPTPAPAYPVSVEKKQ